MIFDKTEPSNEPVISLAVISPDKSTTELHFDNVTATCARLTHVSADEDGLFAYSEDGYVIRDNSAFTRDTIDEILSLERISGLGFDKDDQIVFRNLELEIIPPALTSAPGM